MKAKELKQLAAAFGGGQFGLVEWEPNYHLYYAYITWSKMKVRLKLGSNSHTWGSIEVETQPKSKRSKGGWDQWQSVRAFSGVDMRSEQCPPPHLWTVSDTTYAVVTIVGPILARGLFRLGYDNDSELLRLMPHMTFHEKLEWRLSMPRAFWPQKWLDEDAARHSTR